jgi:uncharacterized glyoxalase superfamily protein PhnB
MAEPAKASGKDAHVSEAPTSVGADDADAVCADLTKRGVQLLNGPIDREWGMRTVCFTYPDGHIWEVAHKLPDDSQRDPACRTRV